MPKELLSLDIALFWLINGAHNQALDVFFAAVTLVGTGWVATPVLMAIVALRPPRGSLNRMVLMGAVALSLSGIINTVTLKPLVKRPRPLNYFAMHPEYVSLGEDDRPIAVHVVGKPLRYRSFPSGHTNTAFAVATVLIVLYGGGAWLAVVPAALVGYSRIYLGVHFPLDVLVGAMLGIAISWTTMAVTRPWWTEQRQSDEESAE